MCVISIIYHVCTAAVLAHSIETAQCCAEQYQQKLLKDRQTTARSLRSYYLRCLAKLLDADFDQYVFQIICMYIVH